MKPDLVITRGIPASGKTNWAREWVANAPEGTRARVNRDDLREQLFGRPAPLAYPMEQAVSAAEKDAVRGLLRAGVSVVVDAAHIRTRYVRGWREVAYDEGAEFSIEYFDNVREDECILRDTARFERGDRAVGEEVIRAMHARLRSAMRAEAKDDPITGGYTYTAPLNGPMAYIVDIDGTLAQMNGRSPYDYTRVSEDLPVQAVRRLTQVLNLDARILVMSGRDESCRADTEAWLHRYDVPFHDLFMRATGERRDDAVVKRELFIEHVAPFYRVLAVFDDRNRVVRMWRSLGLLCCQVAEGAF